jgi:hypothetical protein
MLLGPPTSLELVIAISLFTALIDEVVLLYAVDVAVDV